MAELDEIIQEPSESQKRITQLSGKVKEEAEAREKAEATAKEATEKAAQAERLAQFSEGFVDIVAENPAAKEFKDQIKEKVLNGMSIQDAKFAVLGAAGKLGQALTVEVAPTGGSAPTSIPQTGATKTVEQMTREEKRAALIEAQERGDLAIS